MSFGFIKIPILITRPSLRAEGEAMTGSYDLRFDCGLKNVGAAIGLVGLPTKIKISGYESVALVSR
jgi:hypothetical protein